MCKIGPQFVNLRPSLAGRYLVDHSKILILHECPTQDCWLCVIHSILMLTDTLFMLYIPTQTGSLLVGLGQPLTLSLYPTLACYVIELMNFF